MKKDIKVSGDRRKILKGIATLPFIGSFAYNLAASASEDKSGYLFESAIKAVQDIQGELPKGKLGDWEISRLVLGCNPMGGWSHSRDLRYVGTLAKNWHTETKMKETWAIAEQAGINFCNLVEFQYPIFNEYKKETGSNMLNVCQCSIGREDDRLAPLRKAVDDGADCIYIQGLNTDRLAQTGALDVLFEALEYTHSQNMLFGVGAHSLKTIQDSIEMGVNPDFYYKTFHHDNYWSATPFENREEYPQTTRGGTAPGHDEYNDNMWDQWNNKTIDFFKTIEVPFFGFKVMAAGAITPEDGIRHAFENGADFVCAGMYDFQIVDDVNITIDILKNLGERERPWYS